MCILGSFSTSAPALLVTISSSGIPILVVNNGLIIIPVLFFLIPKYQFKSLKSAHVLTKVADSREEEDAVNDDVVKRKRNTVDLKKS